MTKRRSDYFDKWQKAKQREERRWQIVRARTHKEIKLISRQLREHHGALPDNGEGRSVLEALVRSAPDTEVRHLILSRAPWATDRDIAQLMTHVMSMEPKDRHCTRALGELLQLAKAERDALNMLYRGPRRSAHKIGFYMVKPFDMTDIGLMLERKERRRTNKAARRRKQGRKSRREYLAANQISRAAPWEAEGISRSTWYARRKSGRTSVGPDVGGQSDKCGADNTSSISAGPRPVRPHRRQDAGKVLPFPKSKTPRSPRP